ncbi:MAG: hypothetical protein ACTTJZ_04755 [Sphaerochaetaceae bacterium]
MNKKQNKDDHIAMIRKNRKSTGCLKYNPQAIMRICSNPKAEPFWVADMDFESPKVINDALMKAARHGLYGYPSGNGALEAAHGFIKEHHGIDFPIERIVPTVGVLKSLAILTEKLPGAFIVPMPAYKPFASLCSIGSYRPGQCSTTGAAIDSALISSFWRSCAAMVRIRR